MKITPEEQMDIENENEIEISYSIMDEIAKTPACVYSEGYCIYGCPFLCVKNL